MSSGELTVKDSLETALTVEAPTIESLKEGVEMTRRGEYDRFERNPHYWGVKPGYAAVLIKVISDPDSRAIALQTGALPDSRLCRRRNTDPAGCVRIR